MNDLKERVAVAAQAVENACIEFSGGNGIPSEELAILNKYEAAGMIKFVKVKKELGKLLYLPLMAAPELKGLSTTLYLRLLRRYMDKYGIKSGLSATTVAEYYHSFEKYAFKYDLEGINQVPVDEDLTVLRTVLNTAALGKLAVADEIGLFNELVEDGLI